MALISKNNQTFGLNLLGDLEETLLERTKKELRDFIKRFLRYTTSRFENFQKTRSEKNAFLCKFAKNQPFRSFIFLSKPIQVSKLMNIVLYY